jgi:hypothetical protein
MTAPIALKRTTFVPAVNWSCTVAKSLSSIWRGSTMMSFAPCRAACLMREPVTGWPSVGLTPATRIVCASAMSSSELVAAPVPSVIFIAAAVGEVADPRAAIDVVGAQHHARELLRDVIFLVGAARRAEQADAVGPCFRGGFAQLVGDELIDLRPADFLPLAIAALANHRR